MKIVRTIRAGLIASGLSLVSVLSCCTAKLPIEPAPSGGPQRLVIDTRDPGAFAQGHAEGALNIQLTWHQLEDRTRSYVPDLTRPIALRASTLSKAEEGAAIMQDLGYSNVTLFETGSAPETHALELMMAADLAQVIESGDAPMIIDIREQSEFDGGIIDIAKLVDQDQGPAAIEGLDKNARYLIICEGGWRSSQLASWMELQGFTDVVNVIDGMAGWRDL
jgi:hydroxyacylglutathione hydrolase